MSVESAVYLANADETYRTFSSRSIVSSLTWGLRKAGIYRPVGAGFRVALWILGKSYDVLLRGTHPQIVGSLPMLAAEATDGLD